VSNNNEYMRVYMLERYHARRAEAIARLGGKCAWCDTPEDLQIDHIDWCTKSFSVSALWSVSKERYEAEIAKCQVLCRPHHKVKTRTDLREIRTVRKGRNQYTGKRETGNETQAPPEESRACGGV
jgi:hypothetical protein